MSGIPLGPLVSIALAKADEIYPVPQMFDEKNNPPIFNSKTSAYFYKPPYRFIVDVKMATWSNTDPVLSDGKWVLSWPGGKMAVEGIPWDVPGSYPPATRGANLVLQDDSDSYRLIYSIHLKHGDGLFVEISSGTMTSTWSAGLQPPYGTGVPGFCSTPVQDAAEGWDTYRIALACIMRGVPQQVAVTFHDLPPL